MNCPNCGVEIQEKKKSLFKILTIVLGSLLVLSLVAGGVLIWRFIETNDSYTNLKNDYDELDTDFEEKKREAKAIQSELDDIIYSFNTIRSERDEARKTVDTLTNDLNTASSKLSTTENNLKEAQNQVASLNNQVNSLNYQISSLNQDIKNLQSKGSEEYNKLVSNIRDLNSPATNYYSDRNVVYVKKGSSTNIRIICTISSTKGFNVHSNTANGSICGVKWGSYNSSSKSFPFTITGSSVGSTVITFTNDYNSESFKVLVIVTS